MNVTEYTMYRCRRVVAVFVAKSPCLNYSQCLPVESIRVVKNKHMGVINHVNAMESLTKPQIE
jgi:hypothetical protein